MIPEINTNIEEERAVARAREQHEAALAELERKQAAQEEAEQLLREMERQVTEARKLLSCDAFDEADLRQREQRLGRLQKSTERRRAEAEKARMAEARANEKLQGEREKARALLTANINAESYRRQERLLQALSEAVAANLDLSEWLGFVLQAKQQGLLSGTLRPLPVLCSALLPGPLQADGGFRMVSVVTLYRRELEAHGCPEDLLELLDDGGTDARLPKFVVKTIEPRHRWERKAQDDEMIRRAASSPAGY